jgi:hypothetical protein
MKLTLDAVFCVGFVGCTDHVLSQPMVVQAQHPRDAGLPGAGGGQKYV